MHSGISLDVGNTRQNLSNTIENYTELSNFQANYLEVSECFWQLASEPAFVFEEEVGRYTR